MRREIPLFLTMFFGCFMVLRFFVPHPWVTGVGERLEQWIVIVAAAAVVLGVANVARIHSRRASRREKDWFYSLALLVGLTVMIVLGMTPAHWWVALGAPAGGVAERSPFDYLFNYAYVPMQGTMFSLLAFYIASAAFRAFRVRRLEAALLAVTAVIVMIGRVPVGDVIWHEIPRMQEWIMNVPNNAAKRAILIGAALGAISTGLKIILGIERGAIGGE
jgi:hypothetical protein